MPAVNLPASIIIKLLEAGAFPRVDSGRSPGAECNGCEAPEETPRILAAPWGMLCMPESALAVRKRKTRKRHAEHDLPKKNKTAGVERQLATATTRC